jgi:cytochrome c-type biogenesis protein CcmE
MTARRQRMLWVALLVVGVGIAVLFTRNALKENLLYFYTPSDIVAGKAPADRPFRIGGMVSKGSFNRPVGSLEASFVVTDMAKTVKVRYTGVLPDLFREGQGVIARGRMVDNGTFVAEEVLAKHDENYMPPEVAASLKKKRGESVAPIANTSEGGTMSVSTVAKEEVPSGR